VLSLVSQPLPPPPSQSPKPGSQVWSQAPATQTGVALFQSSGQLVKQSPQRVTSVSVLVSQPLRLTFSSALQLLHPGSQLSMLQVPLLHAEVAWFVLQAALQPPQWSRLTSVAVSHPSAVPPVQSA